MQCKDKVKTEHQNNSSRSQQIKDLLRLYPELRMFHREDNPSSQPFQISIDQLKQLNFPDLSLKTRLYIKQYLRPMPDLDLSQKDTRCTRKFHVKMYEKTPWLCGCEKRNKLFCFVCLLYEGSDSDEHDALTKNGASDLKNLSRKIQTHELFVTHVNNMISFQILGQFNPVSNSLAIDIDKKQMRQHNLKVKKHRYVLSKLIDILKLCGKSRIHTSNESSHIFNELLNSFKKIDNDFNKYINDSAIFTDNLLERIKLELLESIRKVSRRQIYDEIQKTQFVAVMVDRIDLNTIAIVFRYELNCEIYERFWGFFNIQDNQNDNDLLEIVLENIDCVVKNCRYKLVAQCYDGSFNGKYIASRIKNEYKNAHYMHSYTHTIDNIVKQSVCYRIPVLKEFFTTIKDISNEFLKSSDNREKLQKINPKISTEDSCWGTLSKKIQTIFEFKDSIEAYYDGNRFLNNNTFVYWLNYFNTVMFECDKLQSKLEKHYFDSNYIKKAVDDFQDSLESDIEQPNKKQRLTEDDTHNVSDIIKERIKDIFSFKSHISGAKLFVRNQVKSKADIATGIDKLCKAFLILDRDTLRIELDVFHSSGDVGGLTGCMDTLNFILSCGLDKIAFAEITNVLKLLITTPIYTDETERCCYKLRQINSFFEKCGNKKEEIDLDMLFLECDMIQDISAFNNIVIDQFAVDTDNKSDFNFKN